MSCLLCLVHATAARYNCTLHYAPPIAKVVLARTNRQQAAWGQCHTCQPSHIPRDCPAKISGVPLSRSRVLLSRVRPTLRVTACAGSLSKSARRYKKGVGNIPSKSPYLLHVQEEFKASLVVPEISCILPEIPAHVGNLRHIPHKLRYGFLI